VRTKLAAAPAIAAAAFAHYTWVAPATKLELGKTAVVRIGHGHQFPRSEEAIDDAQVEAFAIAPSGARVKLEAARGAGEVVAHYAVKEAGQHLIAIIQDRGVTSRTPQGVRPGGRDKNPGATQASRGIRSAVAYAATPGAPVAGARPIGLEFELSAEMSGGAWRLLLTRHGKPAPGIDLSAFLAGAAGPLAIGKTGPSGSLTWPPPMNAAGPAMVSAEVRDPAPAGAPYDAVNRSASLYLSW
jgi:hypothetical protein